MNYSQIRKMDISDGPGCRVAIYFSGCDLYCKGCHNYTIWDFNSGKEFTDETISKIIELAKPDYIVGLSILGGEPLHDKNINGTLRLIEKFKEVYPNKTIWVWTGYLLKDVIDKIKDSSIDVLIDGKFDIDLFDPKLRYKGSSNQRVIDFKATIKNKKFKPVLYVK